MAECLATQSTVKTVFAQSRALSALQHGGGWCEVAPAHLRDCGLNIRKEAAVLLLFCRSGLWRRTENMELICKEAESLPSSFRNKGSRRGAAGSPSCSKQAGSISRMEVHVQVCRARGPALPSCGSKQSGLVGRAFLPLTKLPIQLD